MILEHACYIARKPIKRVSSPFHIWHYQEALMLSCMLVAYLIRKEKSSPINALRISRLKGVRTCTFDDADECTRVEYDLRRVSDQKTNRYGSLTYHGEVRKDGRCRRAAVDVGIVQLT